MDPPAGLVGVQHGAVEGLSLGLEIPSQEYFSQPPPHLDQAAGGQLKLEVEVEHVND